MNYFEIVVCFAIAVLNFLNIAFLCFLHENGRRITGVGTSVLKIFAFTFCGITLRLGLVEALPLPVMLCFDVVFISAFRRTLVLAGLFVRKEEKVAYRSFRHIRRA